MLEHRDAMVVVWRLGDLVLHNHDWDLSRSTITYKRQANKERSQYDTNQTGVERVHMLQVVPVIVIIVVLR
jgi:hypothetical protein